ncbi:hypothetical protein PAXRUDRAFT_828456 [Paxillus rubicundulus Ve08.2h10]|uniref:Uncharacterized protein n=1 Tax=Paxillus rubicundulus Ve08.2h10 TaxID=930991 RepID=A0A0D0E193_9AGAM|nr:hypothetical protein PAXRUDRAFT_828456 [Paxillus rubicundulus Ve08.2h10]
MPGKPKSGPPYNDPPPGTYITVTNPWGVNPNPRERGQSDVDRLAAWAGVVLLEAGVGDHRSVECVYGMGTRDEVIIQFPLRTDIFPLLGEHRWARIAKKWTGSPNDPRSSCVFIYNWRNNGDPATHNWTETYPNRLPPGSVPSKSPYPPPTWARPPARLANFVISIPPPPTPALPPGPGLGLELPTLSESCPSLEVAPTPSQPGICSSDREQPRSPTTQSSTLEGQPPAVHTSLFSPYQPPPQHPSHAHFLDRNQQNKSHPPSEPTPEPKFKNKLDPYELEEDALNILRSFKPDPDLPQESQEQDIKPVLPRSIKQGPETEVKIEELHTNTDPGYQPSTALLEAFNTLKQAPSSTYELTQDPRKRPLTVSPPASSGYQPSSELEAAINSLLQNAGTPPSANIATTVTNSRSRTTQGDSGPGSVRVKREYGEDEVAFSGGKKIKWEEP